MALLLGAATVCFLNAMRLTAVADVMAIDAAIPFYRGAGLGYPGRARERLDAGRDRRGLRRHDGHGRGGGCQRLIAG